MLYTPTLVATTELTTVRGTQYTQAERAELHTADVTSRFEFLVWMTLYREMKSM